MAGYEVEMIVAGLDVDDDEQADAVFARTQDVTIGTVEAQVEQRLLGVVGGRALAEVGVCEEPRTLREAVLVAQAYLELVRTAVPGVELVELVIRRDGQVLAGPLSRLDGTTAAKVAVVAGLEDPELDELGGLGPHRPGHQPKEPC